MAERNPQAEMPFLEHLEELRWRILYSLIAITLGTVVGWFVVMRLDVLALQEGEVAGLGGDARAVGTGREVTGELDAADVVELAVDGDRRPQARGVAVRGVQRAGHSDAVGWSTTPRTTSTCLYSGSSTR